MVGDLKTGHLLRASPRSQFLTQMAASIPAIVMGPTVFLLFATGETTRFLFFFSWQV
jgi:uncharacterized oligopeptide transporter (OPT) family protein